MDTKLPVRIEAWDGEDKADGWALAVKDMAAWADELLQKCRKTEPIAAAALQELLAHLKD